MTERSNNADTGSGNEPDKSIWNDTSVLIQACIAGNEVAQKRLYDRYSSLVYGIIKRYVRQREAAEEILNDAFCSIFTRLSQFSHSGLFEGWVYRITVNAVAYYYKRNTKHKDVVYGEVAEESSGIPGNAIQNLSYKELLYLVHSIPETQRIVFNLFVFEDFSHRQIAETLGISEGGSRWYLNDARKRLKEKIKQIMKQ